VTATLQISPQLGVLKKRAEFLYVREGRYRAQGALVIQMRANPSHTHIRIGYTATKKIGNAVTRNRAKQRLKKRLERHERTKEFYSRHRPLDIGYDRLLVLLPHSTAKSGASQC